MVGLAFDYLDGPVMVMEPAWGPVDAAVRIGPLPARSASSIVAQVASALSYMHQAWIQHGEILLRNVFLLTNPRAGDMNVTAKLTNFHHAKIVNDQSVFAYESIRFGICIQNLFSKHKLDEATAALELSKLTPDSLGFDAAFRGLGLLVHAIFSGELTAMKDVAERFVGLQGIFEVDEEQFHETPLTPNLTGLDPHRASGAEGRVVALTERLHSLAFRHLGFEQASRLPGSPWANGSELALEQNVPPATQPAAGLYTPAVRFSL